MTPRLRKGPRLFVEGLCERGVDLSAPRFQLSPQDGHYLRDVLRLSVGAPLEVGDSTKGIVFKATIASLLDPVTVQLHEQLSLNADLLPVTLLCALCKGQKTELIVDWATELGCSEIVMWQAERSVVRLRNEDDCATKTARLVKIATAAAQQSKQVKPPRVTVSHSLEKALAHVALPEDAQKLYCSLEPDAVDIGDRIPAETSAGVCLVVGPEGDIAPEEQRILRQHGFHPVSLGPQVLRSELAVVTAIVSVRQRS